MYGTRACCNCKRKKNENVYLKTTTGVEDTISLALFNAIRVSLSIDELVANPGFYGFSTMYTFDKIDDAR